MKSDSLDISIDDGQIKIVTEDGAKFSIPEADCTKCSIVHSSVEELAQYFCHRLVDEVTLEYLVNERDCTKIQVGLSEAPGQEAFYTIPLKL